jgi:hypothetical protein
MFAQRRSFANAGARALAAGVTLTLCTAVAQAFTVNINQGAQEIYLQVGVGAFNGFYSTGGSPAQNATINTVSVTVPFSAIGSGTPQTMSANAGATISYYDGFAFCNVGELYLGAYYRRPNNANVDAVLTASPSGPLTNASGDTIPISQISWTTGGNRSGGPTYIFPGSFTGSLQTIANVARNRWTEVCLTFSYANAVTPAPGTYTARVTYTLTAP